MKNLEKDNLALKSKIAEMEPRLCHCTSGPTVIDESAQAGSSSSCHSPPVAFENDIPLPVQVEVTVEHAVGALIPIPEDEDIEDVELLTSRVSAEHTWRVSVCNDLPNPHFP